MQGWVDLGPDLIWFDLELTCVLWLLLVHVEFWVKPVSDVTSMDDWPSYLCLAWLSPVACSEVVRKPTWPCRVAGGLCARRHIYLPSASVYGRSESGRVLGESTRSSTADAASKEVPHEVARSCWQVVIKYSVISCFKVVSWHRGGVSDLRPEVVGSSLGRALRRENSGQVSHTYVPLSPSSITWYRRKLGSKQTFRAIH